MFPLVPFSIFSETQLIVCMINTHPLLWLPSGSYLVWEPHQRYGTPEPDREEKIVCSAQVTPQFRAQSYHSKTTNSLVLAS